MGLRLQSGEISIHALREEGDLADYLGLPTKVISIHALRAVGDVWSVRTTARPMIFLSTPSARRATGRLQAALHLHHDFYPRPPRGGRPDCNVDVVRIAGFLSTPSARRATTGSIMTLETYRISIHALREEGDQTSMHSSRAVWIFLSTPSARRATVNSTVRFISVGFLSTPSARRATPFRSASFRRSAYFYPRPPRGGRRPPPG